MPEPSYTYRTFGRIGKYAPTPPAGPAARPVAATEAKMSARARQIGMRVLFMEFPSFRTLDDGRGEIVAGDEKRRAPFRRGKGARRMRV